MHAQIREPYCGARVNSKCLPQWSQLLEERLLVIERFSRVTGGGNSVLGHGERSNVGFLVAAAWRCGMAAVIESAREKRRTKSKKMGRSDLLIFSANHTHIIEATFKKIDIFAF